MQSSWPQPASAPVQQNCICSTTLKPTQDKLSLASFRPYDVSTEIAVHVLEQQLLEPGEL